MQPRGKEGKKAYIFGVGHLTKIAAMPIYGKNLKNSSSPVPLETWHVAFGWVCGSRLLLQSLYK